MRASVEAARRLVRQALDSEFPGHPEFNEDELKLGDTALASLTLDQVRPPKQVLDEVMEQLKTGKAHTGG